MHEYIAQILRSIDQSIIEEVSKGYRRGIEENRLMAIHKIGGKVKI